MPPRTLAREAALLLVYATTATIVLSLYGHALNVDASAFLTVGRGWIGGTPPYSGLWDHKPPAIYILAAIASLIDRHGDGVLAFRALSVASVVITALAVDRIVRHLTGRLYAGVAGALLTTALLACPQLSLGGGLTETFATAGLAIALLAVLKSESGSRRAAFAVGAGFGFAVSCSLLSVGVLPSLAYVWISRPADRPQAPKGLTARIRVRSLLWLALGFAIVCAICVLPILFSGSLPAALDAVVGYSALYRSLAIFQPGLWLVWSISFMSPFWLSALIVAVLIKGDEHRQLGRIALIWIAGELAWLLYGERFYVHYMLLLMIPTAMVAVWGLLRCRNLALPRLRFLVSAAYVAILLIGVVGLIGNGSGSPMPEASTNRAAADYIDSHSSGSDGIYVWGISSDIYLSADRVPRGRFFYLLPLITPGLGETAAIEMLQTWQEQPPVFVVDASFETVSHIALPPLLVDHASSKEDGRTDSSALDGLRTFVRDHYDLAATFGDKRIYRYRG
jgi:hypothetical protein